jgi:hypothetical protein
VFRPAAPVSSASAGNDAGSDTIRRAPVQTTQPASRSFGRRALVALALAGGLLAAAPATQAAPLAAAPIAAADGITPVQYGWGHHHDHRPRHWGHHHHRGWGHRHHGWGHHHHHRHWGHRHHGWGHRHHHGGW